MSPDGDEKGSAGMLKEQTPMQEGLGAEEGMAETMLRFLAGRPECRAGCLVTRTHCSRKRDKSRSGWEMRPFPESRRHAWSVEGREGQSWNQKYD